jgi:hypothetical protein
VSVYTPPVALTPDPGSRDARPPGGSPLLRLTDAIHAFLARIRRTLGPLWQMASEILRLFLVRKEGRAKIKPWMLVRRSKAKGEAAEPKASDEDIRRLLERMSQLDDAGRLSERAVGFQGDAADFFCRPNEVREMVEALIRENPPFLHIAREAPAEDSGDSCERQTEYIERDTEVVVREPYLLFIPQTGVEHRESKRPPGYPILRSAKTLSDLRAAPLLYQTLPEDLLIARLLEGSVPILAYREDRKFMLFRPEERIVERREHRHLHVPVEIETGAEGKGTRLIYLLFDRSTSLVHNCAPRGVNAITELAVAVAMVRCDMGRPNARYYFRAFADRLDPIARDPPMLACTVQEKDRLVERLMAMNFSGDATRTVEALEVAVQDIERIVASGELGEGVKPRIGLLTDGRCSLYGGIGAKLKRAGIEMDTVLIGRDAAHNPELMKISSSVSLVDPEVFRAAHVA